MFGAKPHLFLVTTGGPGGVVNMALKYTTLPEAAKEASKNLDAFLLMRLQKSAPAPARARPPGAQVWSDCGNHFRAQAFCE